MAIRVSWGHGTPILGEGEVVGSAMAPFERAMVVSYRLSVTVALSVTIRPQFAIECLRRSNHQGVGHFGPKFPGQSINQFFNYRNVKTHFHMRKTQ